MSGAIATKARIRAYHCADVGARRSPLAVRRERDRRDEVGQLGPGMDAFLDNVPQPELAVERARDEEPVVFRVCGRPACQLLHSR